MWQRIQTVFLALAVLSLIGSILMPIMIGVASDGHAYALYPLHMMQKQMTASGEVKIHTYFPYSLTALFVVAAITVAITEIRKFNNRMLQMKLGMLNSLLILAAMISAVAFLVMLEKAHDFVSIQNDFGLYLIFAALVFNWVALRFIKKDEKLVRDSDRLR